MSSTYSNKKGCLEIICGSMFSGKTEELIRRLRRAMIAKKPTVTFKHSLDNYRINKYVASHNGTTIDAFAIDNPLSIYDLIQPDTQVIGIDEGQFFSHELINVILTLLDQGKDVIVAGLNLDFRSVPFGPMPTLMAIADHVTKLSAICVLCGQDAYFSQRLVNDKPAKYNDPLIQPGAQEAYQARCRSCYVIDKKAVWQNTL